MQNRRTDINLIDNSNEVIIYVESSLISLLSYNKKTKECIVVFKSNYFIEKISYILSFEEFLDFQASDSIGKYYLNKIKTNYKSKTQKMATEKTKNVPEANNEQAKEKRKPNFKNKASDETRYINLRLNLSLVNREWLFKGKEGAYLDVTLRMKPDGEIGTYGDLGFITQDVPSSVYKVDKKARGAILGNGSEKDWENNHEESTPGTGTDFELLSEEEKKALLEKLPF